MADLEYALADATKRLDITREMFNEPPDWLSIPIEEEEVKQHEAQVARIYEQIALVQSMLGRKRKRKVQNR